MPEVLKGPYIVGFNGPPRVGKDTTAIALQSILDEWTDVPVHRQALAGTMRDGAAAILGMTGGDKWYNEIKDQPLQILNGKTFRDFMIDMSEVFVKKTYGNDFWARRLQHTNQSWWYKTPSILLVTDIGFSAEVEYFIENSSGYFNVVLDRAGLDFSVDSRNYVWSQHRGGTDYCLTLDDMTPEEAAKSILQRIYNLGWPVL